MPEAELFLDETQRLCLFQRVRMPEMQEGMRLLNEGLRWIIRVVETEGDFEKEFGDPSSRKLLLAFVDSGEPFVQLREGELEIRIPVAGTDAARLFRELVGQRGPTEHSADATHRPPEC